LPVPDAASAAHSARCGAYIHERIRDAGGSISFAEFMHYALYAPGLGYYNAGTRKFGVDGDFVTAPELSPLFGRVLASQCADVIRALGDAAILEFGAGTGRLAVDLLSGLARLDALPTTYRIVEVSADLRERQQQLLSEALPEYCDRVTWLDRMPAQHRGVIVANEVIDALPVERFRRRHGVTNQLRVAAELGEFVFVEEPAPEVLRVAVEAIESDLGRALPDGYVSEVSLAAPAWVRDVAATLDEGIAILFDYGVSRREYYAADRDEGWLRCHYRHRVHSDPLLLPGIQDLTAWVDFTAVADAAVVGGLDVAGYVTQSQFLLAGGLERELRVLSALPLASRLELSTQVKKLTMPGEMGENVKCIGLMRGTVAAPDAFRDADRTHTL